MDTVRVAMSKGTQGLEGVRVLTDTEGVETAVCSVPADEWTQLRSEVLSHYKLGESTRVDCINIITALTIALTDK